MDVRAFIDNLDNPFNEHEPPADGIGSHPESRPPSIEIALDPLTGRPRQAGADFAGAAVERFRIEAERSLYAFTKGILGRAYLSTSLHIDVSNWAARCPPYRKLLLLPREHAKTSIISHGLPIHLIIQPKEHNIYRPGHAGVDTRIMLAGETERRATNNLSVIEAAFEGNRLLRALWPHCCWENPRKQSSRWNKQELIVPRNIDYPDPTIQAMGVGGAITGARHDIHIKDDLVTLEAANSAIVMETAIMWHLASRALLEDDTSLEFIIGTHWAAFDLYTFIQHGGDVSGEHFEADATVEIMVRSIVEDAKPIYPEKFSIQREVGKQAVVDLQKQFGTLFPLMYMNTTTDPSLVDFNTEDIRAFRFAGGEISFDEDERDAVLYEKTKAPAPVEHAAVEQSSSVNDGIRGMRLNVNTYDLLKARHEHLRLRAR